MTLKTRNWLRHATSTLKICMSYRRKHCILSCRLRIKSLRKYNTLSCAVAKDRQNCYWWKQIFRILKEPRCTSNVHVRTAVMNIGYGKIRFYIHNIIFIFFSLAHWKKDNVCACHCTTSITIYRPLLFCASNIL